MATDRWLRLNRPIQDEEELAIVLRKKNMAVARLIPEGFTNSQIAARLNISEQIVKNRLRIIFDVSGSNNRIELARWLVGLGVGVAPKEFNWRLLTLAQLQVAKSIAAGLTNREIAHDMQRSENAIKARFSRIKKLMGVYNRVTLAAAVTKRGGLDDVVPSSSERIQAQQLQRSRTLELNRALQG